MKTKQTLRVHNAIVTERMQSPLNRLHTEKKLGRKPRLESREDRNALAFHYIESGAIKRFSASNRIIVKTA
jgi:hypothetical protein